MPNNFLERTELLIGQASLTNIGAQRVILFGVGGVGSWCAESLVRSGVTRLTLVDGDVVSPSNINRQLIATHSTLGRAKVAVLQERLLDINPHATITPLPLFFTRETATDFPLNDFDYVIDCIDTLSNKAYLLHYASTMPTCRIFSSMGAARKIDPTMVRVGELFSVRGCPLGAALRKKLRREGLLPQRPVTCVYSAELLDNQEPSTERVNGSIAHVTAAFGFTLAGLVIQDMIKRE